MGNLKHAIAAFIAVSLVGSLAVVQAISHTATKADKMTQGIEVRVIEDPEVLVGDGDGETPPEVVPAQEIQNTIEQPQDATPVLAEEQQQEASAPAEEQQEATAEVQPAVEAEPVEFTVASQELQLYEGKDAYVLTSGGSVNLRSAADTESTILNVLKLGDKVKILETEGDWFKVEAGEYTGYILSEFISLDESSVKRAMLTYTMYQNGTATQSINVRGYADENALILSQVAQGDSVIVLETTDNGWHKVYFGANYDIGYVSAEYITIGEMVDRTEVNKKRAARINKVAKKAHISGDKVVVKLLPSEESETITTLANKTECKIISGGTNWTKIIVKATNEIGYVRTSNVKVYIEPTPQPAKPKANQNNKNTNSKKTEQAKEEAPVNVPASGKGAQLVQQAAKYLGVKYVYGGTSPSGFDCSGLVQYCLRKLGVSISRTAASQYSHGVAVSKNNLQPGDLVFFSRGGGRISHVVIYAGNGQVIHAPRTGKTVCYQSLSSLCSYSKYVGAKRVL